MQVHEQIETGWYRTCGRLGSNFGEAGEGRMSFSAPSRAMGHRFRMVAPRGNTPGKRFEGRLRFPGLPGPQFGVAQA